LDLNPKSRQSSSYVGIILFCL